MVRGILSYVLYTLLYMIYVEQHKRGLQGIHRITLHLMSAMFHEVISRGMLILLFLSHFLGIISVNVMMIAVTQATGGDRDVDV